MNESAFWFEWVSGEIRVETTRLTLELYHPAPIGGAKTAAKSRRFGTGRCDPCGSGNRFGKVLGCEVCYGSRSGKLVGFKVPTALRGF
ncbi:MAG: hypothetical protein EHM77_05020 [Planctomycetaceae bacterium]|nr:MAG: hypothetical protein EHM77_05020 [Planctomycetaceae bacterium]